MNCAKGTRSERNRAAQGWVKSLVKEHAAKLHSISLSVRALDIAPPMIKLKHLVLVTKKPISVDCCRSLACLPQMATMFLECSVVHNGHQYVIDLCGCVQLQRVCFATWLPAEFWVSEACSVVIKCTAERLLDGKCSWLEQCSSVELRMEEDDEFVDYKEWLDAREAFVVTSKVFFPNLTSLRLDAQNVGMLNDHMVVGSDTLPELRDLKISTRTLFISFQPSAKLKVLYIFAEYLMRLDVQDQLALCARLERFCCHGKWKDCDGAAASIECGLQHSGRFPGLKPVMRRFEVINSCGNKARMAKIAKLAFPQDAVDDEGFRCICQTCNSCIGISGL